MSTHLSRPVWEIEARAAERGKALSASANYRHLQLAREAADRAYRKLGRPISSDDIRAEAPELFEYTSDRKRNWMGAVWGRSKWIPVGRVKSTTPGSHANDLRTWILKEGRAE